jgi:murein DD-endopeptidase MepM/ murein hydrolase activator NlpD
MFKHFFILMLLPIMLWGAYSETMSWENGETYLTYLEKQKLPQKTLYYDLDKEDQKLTEEIISGTHYQVLYDQNGTLEQVLIPVNDELQLHIFKENGAYAFQATPIISETKRHAFMLQIESSPYNDILKATGSVKIAHSFIQGFKNSLNFRRDLRKGDPLVMIYEQKYRMGQPFGMPKLQAAMIEMRKKRHYIYLNENDRYYDEKGREVEGFLLSRPVHNGRVSSGFTKRRYHPILKKYRAHLGIDYAARPGTPIMAAGSGRVIFKGYTRGYGKLTKIQHNDGYMTLYAHQRAYRKGIYKGKYVKKGQVIGYVGSTGLSTGPHLHFGLYKNGRAINPARVVQVTTHKLKGQKLQAFKQLQADFNNEIELYMAANSLPEQMKAYDTMCYVDSKTCKKVAFKEEVLDETLQ